MKTLSPESFTRARQFIMTNGRQLEIQRFIYHFENGSDQAVQSALFAYQNEDGGFGHGLEPDFRLPDSSALATTVGLQILREVVETAVSPTAVNPLVHRAIHYFRDTYNPDGEMWLSVPPTVNNHPHAFWWTWPDIAGRHAEQRFYANPHAEIAAHLWHYAELMPDDMLEAVTAVALSYIKQLPAAMEMHDLLCYLWLMKSDNLPDDARQTIQGKLTQAIAHTVATDPAQWAGYGLQPLGIINTPNDPFADQLADAIQVNLDYLIDQQGDDGAWSPNWDWSALDANAWSQAKKDWQGVLTLKALRQLRAFGRIEN